MAKAVEIHRQLRARNAARAATLLVGCCCCAAAGGCFGGAGPRPSLSSNDPLAKIPAIKTAADARKTQTAPELIASLESDDPAIRFYAIRGLQDLTGETFGYIWYLDKPQLRPAIERWKQWLNNGSGGSLAGGQ